MGNGKCGVQQPQQGALHPGLRVRERRLKKLREPEEQEEKRGWCWHSAYVPPRWPQGVLPASNMPPAPPCFSPQALSAECIRNTSFLHRCDYFSNAFGCCCVLKSTNSFKSIAEFKVACCHFAFSQTMDTQSITSVK